MKHRKARQFIISTKMILSTHWDDGIGLWVFSISIISPRGEVGTFYGHHETSPLKAFKKARLALRCWKDPEFRKVYERISRTKNRKVVDVFWEWDG